MLAYKEPLFLFLSNKIEDTHLNGTVSNINAKMNTTTPVILLTHKRCRKRTLLRNIFTTDANTTHKARHPMNTPTMDRTMLW